ncbi:MAG: peptide chain release factor N(5)-glutamine methyltransferase [Pirellulaceae bacterium]|nr:peptide chain release factor N(5)-glutamine methyltransferase [Pirellulaceae bacterium]
MSVSEPWTVGRLLNWTADYFKQREADSPRLDAEVLLAHALGCRRIELYTRFDETPGEAARSEFREFVRRRGEGTPVAYLVGSREFYSIDFRVTPDVLIPRPETELLVVAVLDLAKAEGNGSGFSGQDSALETGGSGVPVSPPVPRPPSPAPPISIADVGTGSGCIAVSLAKHLPACRVTALDISPAALAIASENARSHGLDDRVEFAESDLLAAVGARRFDFIVSNPPYVADGEWASLSRDVRDFEPRGALAAGPRGTEVIERLIPQAAEHLRAGGHLLIEIGPAIHDAVCGIIECDGRFELGSTIKDLARLPRVVRARLR